MNDPDPADVDLQSFYQKIVVKEHYKYLQLCGATTVSEPADLAHVDTSIYLPKAAEGEDETVVSQMSLTVAVQRRIRQRSSVASPREVRDVQGLRGLLMSQRSSRLLLHTNYDRNLTGEDDLGVEIRKKSAHNRQLQRIMSRIRPPMERSASWTEKDTQICRERSTKSADSSRGPGKRSATVDLGSTNRMGTYSPFGSSPGTPLTPSSPLDAVFEENETDFGQGDDPAPKIWEATPEEIPLISDSDPTVGAVRGDKSKKSRNKLQRQDDLKPDENKDGEQDDAV
ncbi:hypothetical protein BaRGS_00031622 [Batillaria attramentaria]|uniref:Uncharacterized protein n=1 Tax=Batillaria attramentaria TaxID=370345 RepID=A0ABD0JQW4_9CAEN